MLPGVRGFLRRNAGWLPEVLILALAVALRVLVWVRFDPRWGYDAESHLSSIEWFRDHGSAPPLAHSRVAYHPPLFYALEAVVLRAAGLSGVPLLGAFVEREPGPALLVSQGLPLAAGLLWLLVSLLILRRLLPAGLAPARWVAFLLLAILPTSVHLAAMVSNEGLNVLFAGAAMLSLLFVVRPSGWGRWVAAVGLGIALGLGLLTKVSALVVALAALFTGLFSLLWQRQFSLGARLGPWVLAFATVVAIAGPYHVRAFLERGQVLTGPFDRPGRDRDQYLATGAEEKSIWAHRRLGYFVGWKAELFNWPFFPVGSQRHPRFWPVLVASTFVDHYNYGLGRDPEAGRLPDDLTVNGWRLRPIVRAAARVAFVSGSLVALSTALGFFALLPVLWRRREVGALGLLSLSALGIAGQLHFAVLYPVDAQGVVKGAYLLFAAAPLAAVFGVAVLWLWRRRAGRPLAVLNLLALAGILGYLGVNLAVSFGVRAFVFWPGP